jgi:hypothetical protein
MPLSPKRPFACDKTVGAHPPEFKCLLTGSIPFETFLLVPSVRA